MAMANGISEFSSGYYLVNADAVSYTGSSVTVPHDMFGALLEHSRDPLLKLSTGHYRPAPEHGIPAATVAVPDHIDINDKEEVLLAKDKTVAQRLFQEDLGD